MSEWYNAENFKCAIENAKEFKIVKGNRMGEKSMVKEHQYHFEFKYNKMVNGVKKEYVVPITAINKNYNEACNRVNEYVRENFGERVDEDSRIKYVGEFIDGELKPFVEEVKESENEMFERWLGKSKKELVGLNLQLNTDLKECHEVIEVLRKRCGNNKTKINNLEKSLYKQGFKIKDYEEVNKKMFKDLSLQMEQNNELEKRVKEFEEKQKKLNAVYNGGFQFLSGSRGSGKSNYETELFKKLFKESFIESKTADVIQEMIKKIEKQEMKVYDVNSLYPQAVHVCKVYQIERDQALKENESLSNKVSGYKKELGKLNMLMDDMEDRLDREKTVKQSMIKQMKDYKMELKRKNKIIDALTEDKDEK